VSDPSALKALTRETKALIIVSEFEARRMPVFQMRSVLQAIVTDDEDRKIVIDMVERDLRATGYSPEKVSQFLTDLLASAPQQKPMDMMAQSVQTTRRLRSPFAMGFEGASIPPAPPPPGTPPPPPPDPAPAPMSSDEVAAEKPKSTPPTRASFMKSSAPLQAPVPPSGPAPTVPPPPAGSRTATPPTGTRRNTFAFVSPTPTDSVPTGVQTPTTAGSTPAGDAPLVGTMAWRLQQAFGGKPGSPNARVTILIADDDKRIRMVFRLRLEEQGAVVVECENGLEAWERLQKGDISLAILDMKMPGLHGLEVLSHMADKNMSTPVIICSAYDQLQDEFVVRTYPNIKYLVKPVAPDQLVATVKDLLTPKGR
jgi:CheY-like chemotaxis protein